MAGGLIRDRAETGRTEREDQSLSKGPMRWFPREHGATVIWVASLLLAFALLRARPSLSGSLLYVGIALVALVILARLTRGSVMLARLERHPVLLPALSASLTVLVPLGQLLMVDRLSPSVVSAWLVFLTYVAAGVVITREMVRAVLKGPTSTGTGVAGAGTILGIEGAGFALVHWLSPVALTVLVPWTLQRWYVARRTQDDRVPRVRRIRIIGLTQSASLVAAAILLAIASLV